jgi:hypothetical protein
MLVCVCVSSPSHHSVSVTDNVVHRINVLDKIVKGVCESV